MATADLLQMTDKRTADRQKALDSALAQIERQFGKGSIMKLGGDNPMPDIEATSTGSLGLDIALPTKISSFNFDKDPVVSGVLQGIKGQYLIFEKGVINIRKFTSYEVTVG